MQFNEINDPSLKLITRIENGIIWINNELYEHSLWINRQSVHRWQPTASMFSPADLQPLIEQQPDIIILGVASPTPMLCMPSTLTSSIMQQGIGIEIMSVTAACHTYNLLANEDRHSLLGLSLASAG